MNREVMFSSKTDQWATPNSFFAEIDKEFHFTLDPCADEFNHKCDKWYGVESNGLLQNWGGIGCFVTRPTAERLLSGCVRHITKATRIIRLCVC